MPCGWVFKLRWGLTFNQLKVLLYKHMDKTTGLPFTTAACLLCGQPEGSHHLFSSCQHPHIKQHIISRHNQAVLTIFKAVGQGKLGGCYSVVDATRQDNLPDGVASNRLPTWLLPDMDADLLRKKRPDTLIIKGLPATEARLMATTGVKMRKRRLKCEVFIVEVGSSSTKKSTLRRCASMSSWYTICEPRAGK